MQKTQWDIYPVVLVQLFNISFILNGLYLQYPKQMCQYLQNKAQRLPTGNIAEDCLFEHCYSELLVSTASQGWQFRTSLA